MAAVMEQASQRTALEESTQDGRGALLISSLCTFPMHSTSPGELVLALAETHALHVISMSDRCCSGGSVWLQSRFTSRGASKCALVTFFKSFMEDSAAQPASVSLGKGAWDCDLNVAIPPEKEVAFLRHMSDHASCN